MEHKFNTQINQSGRLMKEFVDTVISFYQNIKQQDVSRIMDAQTLSRLQQQEIPAQGLRWRRYTINCWRTYTQTPL